MVRDSGVFVKLLVRFDFTLKYHAWYWDEWKQWPVPVELTSPAVLTFVNWGIPFKSEKRTKIRCIYQSHCRNQQKKVDVIVESCQLNIKIDEKENIQIIEIRVRNWKNESFFSSKYIRTNITLCEFQPPEWKLNEREIKYARYQRRCYLAIIILLWPETFN